MTRAPVPTAGVARQGRGQPEGQGEGRHPAVCSRRQSWWGKPRPHQGPDAMSCPQAPAPGVRQALL